MATVVGDTGDNTLTGTGDADILRGYEGSDTLYGGGGNDLLDSGQGAGNGQLGDGDVDTMYGGEGNDTYIVRDVYDRVIEDSGPNGGIDTVKALVSFTLPANVEILSLEGTDNINGTGNSLNNTIKGNTGNNAIFGGGGNDSLAGGAGDDRLSGDAGDDFMSGGAGNDVYFVDSVKDGVVELANNGTELVNSFVSYTLTANVENLQLGGSAVTATGNDLDNIIAGNALNNIITGGGGHDSLYGAGGADTFIFGAPDDTSWDAVRAFETGIDKLQFKASDGYTTNFIKADAAVGTDAQFFLNVYHNLYFDFDGEGAQDAILIAGFGTYDVNQGDIVLV